MEVGNNMKWWGWGDINKQFDISKRPALWPYICKNLNLDVNHHCIQPVVDFKKIQLPVAKINSFFLEKIKQFLKEDQIKFDKYERLLHAYGKSFRDLWRMRNGEVDYAPDCICYPESEEDVMRIINAANDFQVVIVPFGGGTNIVGCLEVKEAQGRMVLSLDMRRMQRIIHIDPFSMIAQVQPGMLGPSLEAKLNAEGFTLGHFPDSFEYSSVGGWVATRSAGMQSDKYGKIEDMVIALRLVTPNGTLNTRLVPKASNGINVNHLGIGSEGILGVITEISIQIHRLPSHKEFHGYLFADFNQAMLAVYQTVMQGCAPSMSRLNDPHKTALSFAYKTKTSGFGAWAAKGLKFYLQRVKKLDLKNACLLLNAFEGAPKDVAQQKKAVNAIYKSFGGIPLGTKPGRSFEKDKYDFPYLRDFAFSRAISADVSETATTWANLSQLYQHTTAAILKAIASTGSTGWCGCHLSHTYHTGASLYFTFAFPQQAGHELEQYQIVKHAAESAFLQYGGTLSHHHAVGYEHLPWIEQDLSAPGLKAIAGIKNALDPLKIMNPGKIVPAAYF